MASLNRMVRFNNQCGLEVKITQGRGSNLGADEVVIANGGQASVSFRGQVIGSSFNVAVSGGPPAGTNFTVSAREVTILSSGPTTRYGLVPGRESLAAMACDNQRIIATPLSYLDPRGQIIGVATPGLIPGMTCDVSADNGGSDLTVDDEPSFWERNRVWIIILIVLSVLLLLGAIILALFLSLKRRKKAKQVTTIDEVGNLVTTTVVDDD